MGIDISQLGKDAQAQIMAKMAVQEVKNAASTATARSCATASSSIPSVRRRGSAS